MLHSPRVPRKEQNAIQQDQWLLYTERAMYDYFATMTAATPLGMGYPGPEEVYNEMVRHYRVS